MDAKEQGVARGGAVVLLAILHMELSQEKSLGSKNLLQDTVDQIEAAVQFKMVTMGGGDSTSAPL